MAQARVFQGVLTKYLPASNHRPSRIVASAYAGRKTVNYDHGLDSFPNHQAAAEALANKFGWLARGESLVAGGTPDGAGYMFAIVEKSGE